MSFGVLARAWNRFFFEPQPTTPLCLFRILYGLLILANLLLLRRDWAAWYGPRAWISLDTMRTLEPGPRINLFPLLPASNAATELFFWVFLLVTLLLTAGLWTRFSSIAVFVCLVSMQQRNLYIIHSGDAFLRVAGFFLMFAPASATLSVDRLIRLRQGKEGPEPSLKAPWAQRIVQIEMSLLYFVAFWWKSSGSDWVNGTALYYVYHLDQFHRFPMPAWLLHPALLRVETWLAMLTEFSLGTLVWFRSIRYYVLLAGVLMHLTIEYSMNVPLFEWVMMSTYVLFIDPADLDRVSRWMVNRLPRHRADPPGRDEYRAGSRDRKNLQQPHSP